MRLVEFLVGFRCFLACRNACTHLQNLEQDKMISVEENGIILSHDYPNTFGVAKAFDEFFEERPKPVISLTDRQGLIMKLSDCEIFY